ncbi:MAG: hypothetical protein IH851_04245 [Armatimonadetes bacterium]|nr:hypothetical protein [Armatimonadota bacterium]
MQALDPGVLMKSGKWKRLWKWAALGGGVMLLGVGTFLVPMRSGHGQYEFLAGHRPVSQDIDWQSDVRTAAYQFRADFGNFVDEASTELAQERGWRVTVSNRDRIWTFGSAEKGTAVVIHKGYYAFADEFGEVRWWTAPKEGWVTVFVTERLNSVERFWGWVMRRLS